MNIYNHSREEQSKNCRPFAPKWIIFKLANFLVFIRTYYLNYMNALYIYL